MDSKFYMGICIRGSSRSSPASFFFFQKKSGGKINPKNFENSGGDLVRPHIKNLASPISDFAPPSTPIQFITNSPTLAGGYSTPRAMDRRIIATIA